MCFPSCVIPHGLKMNVLLFHDSQHNPDVLHCTRLACYQMQTALEEGTMNNPANRSQKNTWHHNSFTYNIYNTLIGQAVAFPQILITWKTVKSLYSFSFSTFNCPERVNTIILQLMSLYTYGFCPRPNILSHVHKLVCKCWRCLPSSWTPMIKMYAQLSWWNSKAKCPSKSWRTWAEPKCDNCSSSKVEWGIWPTETGTKMSEVTGSNEQSAATTGHTVTRLLTCYEIL